VMSEYGNIFGEQDILELIEQLNQDIEKVNNGNMRRAEAMLFSQAAALQAIFTNLSRRALKTEYVKNLETYLRLALKAQSQCRATLETLSNIKNPPVVYAKQANIAHGPQQINNSAAEPTARTEKNFSQPNELLEAQHGGETMDSGTTQTASGKNPAMATLD
jgi:DNA polymerase III delta prime subunit